jgi:hypothetical protein
MLRKSPLKRTPFKKKGTKIKPVSDKRKREGKEYATLRMVFLTNRSLCEAMLVGCTFSATDVHHKARRGANYLRVDTWLPVCRSCHQWIESHPKESREAGWLL